MENTIAYLGLVVGTHKTKGMSIVLFLVSYDVSLSVNAMAIAALFV